MHEALLPVPGANPRLSKPAKVAKVELRASNLCLEDPCSTPVLRQYKTKTLQKVTRGIDREKTYRRRVPNLLRPPRTQRLLSKPRAYSKRRRML